MKITFTDLVKAGGHKYVRRTGSKGNYKYTYAESAETGSKLAAWSAASHVDAAEMHRGKAREALGSSKEHHKRQQRYHSAIGGVKAMRQSVDVEIDRTIERQGQAQSAVNMAHRKVSDIQRREENTKHALRERSPGTSPEPYERKLDALRNERADVQGKLETAKADLKHYSDLLTDYQNYRARTFARDS